MLSEYSDILTIRDAMTILGVSRSTIYDLIRTDSIHAFKVGPKIWRIKKSDLMQYIQEQ